jgi:subtilisin family serine protease
MSNSWWHSDDPELKEAIVRARDAGVLFVAAAGNFSEDNDDPANYYRYPSSYDVDNIVSVMAIDSAESIAWFTSFGATTVDLAAPGVDVLSSVPSDGYDSYSGTSRSRRLNRTPQYQSLPT